MSDLTPAITRAAHAIVEQWNGHAAIGTTGTPESFSLTFAYHGVVAALTDPDDPDSLARTLFVLNAGVSGWPASDSVMMWNTADDRDGTHEHWRAVADGLRMMLTGEGS